jgi:hypothetical protein
MNGHALLRTVNGVKLVTILWIYKKFHASDVGALSIGIDESDDSTVNPTNAWNISGNQGDAWYRGFLAIGKMTSPFQVIL